MTTERVEETATLSPILWIDLFFLLFRLIKDVKGISFAVRAQNVVVGLERSAPSTSAERPQHSLSGSTDSFRSQI